LPLTAVGIGGDDARVLHVPRANAAVVGIPSPERDAIARRLGVATGSDVLVCDSAFALTMPGRQAPRIVICTQPTSRSLREAMRAAPRGLIEPTPVPFRAVAIIDGVASAVQVLPG
jgi:hypothetical protein